MALNLFVSGSWENREIIRNLMTRLQELGYKITADWTNHTDQGRATEYAAEDLKGICACDALIYCHDSHKTGGKVYEIGYAHGLGKNVILYSFTGIDFKNGCVFIRGQIHPRARNFEELLKHLERIERGLVR